jgi:hypothetical protein
MKYRGENWKTNKIKKKTIKRTRTKLDTKNKWNKTLRDEIANKKLQKALKSTLITFKLSRAKIEMNTKLRTQLNLEWQRESQGNRKREGEGGSPPPSNHHVYQHTRCLINFPSLNVMGDTIVGCF